MNLAEQRMARDQRIIEARARGMSAREIASQESIGRERVKQILRGQKHDPAASRRERFREIFLNHKEKTRALEAEARRYGMLDLLERPE